MGRRHTSFNDITKWWNCCELLSSNPGLKAFKDISSLNCRLKVIKAIFFIAVQLHLNRQIITLLSGLKIRNDFFQELQEKMLFELSDMLLDNDVALNNLREVSSFSLSLWSLYLLWNCLHFTHFYFTFSYNMLLPLSTSKIGAAKVILLQLKEMSKLVHCFCPKKAHKKTIVEIYMVGRLI